MSNINDYILKEMNANFTNAPNKILGVYIDELYCYVPLEIVNSSGITYILDDLRENIDFKKIILSEKIEDKMQEKLVAYLAKHNIPFSFTAIYSEKDNAGIAIVTENEDTKSILEYQTNIPLNYLNAFNKTLCKKHYDEIKDISLKASENFKKQSFINKDECAICEKEK